MTGTKMPVDPNEDALDEIKASGIPWDDEALARLRGFMRGESATGPRDVSTEVVADPERAQEQARLFVRHVVNTAKEEGADQVNLAIFDHALSRLCPGFWPFC